MIAPGARLAATVLCAGLVLSGCSVDVRGELRRSVADLTEDANDRDVDAVRQGAQELIDDIDAAVGSGEVTAEEGARITELATLLRDRADLVAPPEEPAPTEDPTPSEEPEPTQEPAPTQEPEPSEQPEPTQSPRPTPSARPTQAPEPTQQPAPTEEPEEPEDDEPLVPVPTG